MKALHSMACLSQDVISENASGVAINVCLNLFCMLLGIIYITILHVSYLFIH